MTFPPEEEMEEATRGMYRAILHGVIGSGYRVSSTSPSGNVAGHWIIETDGFTIEFGPTNNEE